MPRNGSGAYTPPSNSFNPAVANTTIDPAAWAQILSDLAAAITASIARDGQTATSQRIPFAAGVGLNDGAVALPALAFTGSPTTGLYASGVDELAVAIDGARQVKISEDGLELAQPLPVASGGTGAANAAAARASLGLAVGTDVQAHDGDLDAMAALSANGLVARTGSSLAAVRTLTGTGGEVAVSNGDGVAGNPTVSLPSSLTFTGKTIAGGTFNSPALVTPALGVATATSIAATSWFSAKDRIDLADAAGTGAIFAVVSATGGARIDVDSVDYGRDCGLLLKHSGAIKWAVGVMGNSVSADQFFYIARYGAGGKGLKIDPTTTDVTVTEGLNVGSNLVVSGNIQGVAFSSFDTVIGVPSGAATTFFTCPNSQSTFYEVYAQCAPGAGNTAGWGRATLQEDHVTGSINVINATSGGITPLTISMSGFAAQVTQFYGAAVNIDCCVLRIK